MKTSIIAVLLCLSAYFSNAQTTKVTTTLKVAGNCEHCKERIENALDIKGVKSAKWDADTKEATITYDSTKVKLPTLEAAIVGAGHDLVVQKAPDKVYRSLPACCKYRK